MRLPRSDAKMSTANMERFLRLNGITNSSYLMWTGGQRLRDFIVANPDWTLRRWADCVAENMLKPPSVKATSGTG